MCFNKIIRFGKLIVLHYSNIIEQGYNHSRFLSTISRVRFYLTSRIEPRFYVKGKLQNNFVSSIFFKSNKKLQRHEQTWHKKDIKR